MSNFECENTALLCVPDAVPMNAVGKPATDSCLDKLTAVWLDNARDRRGGRKQHYQLTGQRHTLQQQPDPLDDGDDC